MLITVGTCGSQRKNKNMWGKAQVKPGQKERKKKIGDKLWRGGGKRDMLMIILFCIISAGGAFIFTCVCGGLAVSGCVITEMTEESQSRARGTKNE